MSFKIYTRSGDAGETGLLGGARVRKDDVRIEAYGTVDELNSGLGLLVALSQNLKPVAAAPSLARVEATLLDVQRELFTIGSLLASPGADAAAGFGIAPVTDGDVGGLERAIDELDGALAPLTSFILPGGGAAAAQAQVCRAVARRAERRVVALADAAEVDPRIVRYLNRLSDYLFTLARALTAAAGAPERKWVARA